MTELNLHVLCHQFNLIWELGLKIQKYSILSRLFFLSIGNYCIIQNIGVSLKDVVKILISHLHFHPLILT